MPRVLKKLRNTAVDKVKSSPDQFIISLSKNLLLKVCLISEGKKPVQGHWLATTICFDNVTRFLSGTLHRSKTNMVENGLGQKRTRSKTD